MTVKLILSKVDVFPPAEIQAQTWNVLIAEVLQNGPLSCLEKKKKYDKPFLSSHQRQAISVKKHVKEA